MSKTILAAALCLAITPALAQAPSSSPTSPPMQSQTPSATTATSGEAFLQAQKSSDWRASKLIGMSITGADNSRIGDVNDVLFDSNGNAQAVVIGVGGFLGVGEKDVAIPFSKLQVTPTAAGDKIEKITVSYKKEELQNAPTFKWIAAAAPPAPAQRPMNNAPRQ